MCQTMAEYKLEHPAPRGPVLLLSCIDLRLLDEIVRFMAADGLTNRYDHITLAGASLGALGVPRKKGKLRKRKWKKTFFGHMDVAYGMRKFKEVYIIEHRDCGAYKEFLGPAGEFDDGKAAEEEACHRKYVRMLEKAIRIWANVKKQDDTAQTRKDRRKIRVRAFLMDLRGRVRYLSMSP